MKRYSVQFIAYSNGVEIIAESREEEITKLHQNYGLSELGIADTGEEVLSVEEVKKENNTPVKKGVDTSLCSHTKVRFVTEFVKKVPEGYEAMQKKEEINIEKDYQTIGYIINKHICCDCGTLLFSDEP
ncbi:hypothetical protein ES703_33232 [subsurface metagenome]